MQYTTLGSTDLRVSRICLGTVFRSGADETTCRAAIDAAADMGCTFIDCANIYREGFSERVVGKALYSSEQQGWTRFACPTRRSHVWTACPRVSVWSSARTVPRGTGTNDISPHFATEIQ